MSVECRCGPSLALGGSDAEAYAQDHLLKRFVNEREWLKGFVCPDSGQLWLMDFPESELQGGGPPRLRLVAELEWEAAKPKRS